MFLIFKNVVLYLSILSPTFAQPADENENKKGITPNTEQAVQQEMLPFAQIIQFLEHPPAQIPPIQFLELGIQLKSKLDMLARRAVKVDELLKHQGAQDNQNEIFSKMLHILGVRSKIETLVDDLYPVRRPYHIGVAKAFEEILTSTKQEFKDRSCIKVFRERVKNYGVSAADFIDGIRSIYGSFSDKVAHKMSAFEPSAPKYNDITGIEEMLEMYGITPNELKVKTAQIILEPLPLLNTTNV